MDEGRPFYPRLPRKSDPRRPPLAHARRRGSRRRAAMARRPRALARHAGRRPDGGRADDVHESLVRRAFEGALIDGTPLLNRAHAEDGAGDRARMQDRERDRDAGDASSAAAAAGMKASGVMAALWQGFTSTGGAPRATTWSSRSPFSLVGPARASRRSRPRPTCRSSKASQCFFEIWVCADGY